MVSALGNVGSGQTAYGTVASPELAQLKTQLADCVNCDTAKTSQGQARIELLSARIAAIQGRQQQLERSGAPAASLPVASSDGPMGKRLDVYA